MSSGRLGVAAPVATTNTTVYTVPGTASLATFNMTIVNTSGAMIKFRVGIATTGSPSSSEWIEYDATLFPSEVWEKTALVASTNERVVVFASALGLSVRVYGFEQ